MESVEIIPDNDKKRKRRAMYSFKVDEDFAIAFAWENKSKWYYCHWEILIYSLFSEITQKCYISVIVQHKRYWWNGFLKVKGFLMMHIT